MPLPPPGTGFLSFNSMPPRLHITADTDDFDEVTIQHWKDEGFDVTYFPLGDGGKEYRHVLQHLADDLELGENYALVAYGEAAHHVLQAAIKPMPHMCALVCYYPSSLPYPNAKYPTSINLLVHLAASQPFAPVARSYVYPDTVPGFAENDLDEFDKTASALSWTRTLGNVRKAFGIDVDLEAVWEEHVALEFAQKDAAATLRTMVPSPYVNHIPTLTGGIGARDLLRFYRDFFIPSNPPSLKLKLLSRTIGVDRVVDELLVTFRHTQEIPWLLPGVPPTNKEVKVVLVSIVCIRGGKLYHEHIYWDQATVLVQLGLLDAKLVPKEMKDKGMKRLPVAGAEAASKVLDEESVPSNELIDKW